MNKSLINRIIFTMNYLNFLITMYHIQFSKNRRYPTKHVYTKHWILFYSIPKAWYHFEIPTFSSKWDTQVSDNPSKWSDCIKHKLNTLVVLTSDHAFFDRMSIAFDLRNRLTGKAYLNFRHSYVDPFYGIFDRLTNVRNTRSSLNKWKAQPSAFCSDFQPVFRHDDGT